MNILEAMKYVKKGRRVQLGDTILKQGENGELLRDHSREFKVRGDEPYAPTQEEMLSDDWVLVTEELPDGSIVRVHETDLVVHSGYRGRKYLVDTYQNRIIFEYENETLMLKDIHRREGEVIWA